MTAKETFWEREKRKAIQKEITRSIHMLRTNPDYQKNYPNEKRDNPEFIKEPHPEAVIRIKKDIAMKTQNAFSPKVERPVRLNR